MKNFTLVRLIALMVALSSVSAFACEGDHGCKECDAKKCKMKHKKKSKASDEKAADEKAADAPEQKN